MQRRTVLIVGVALIGVAAFVFLRRDRSPAGSSASVESPGARSLGGVAAATGRAGAATEASGVPAALLQIGVPDRRIAGTVTFEGAPVQGAVVVLSSHAVSAGAVPPARVATSADGRFDFGERPSMPYAVSASAPGRAPAVERLDLRKPTSRPPPDQLELRLGACEVTIAGVVRDASGGVIQGALVGPTRGAAAISDTRGSYELCARKGEHRIEVSATGYGGVSLFVAAHVNVRRDVILVPEATFIGTVVRAADGSPVERALVSLWPAQFGRERPTAGAGVTDAQGRFSIAELNPGRYWARAAAPGLGTGEQVEVLLEAGQSAERTLRLETRAMVRGRVVENDEPVAGVTVGLTRRAPLRYSVPGVSQADGSFAIHNAPIGTTVIRVSPYEAVAPTELTVPSAGLDDVIVEVRTMAALRGRVLFDGKPVEGAQVGTHSRKHALSEADGRYEILGLAAGVHTLYAQSERVGAFVGDVTVTLAQGEQRELDLDLPYAGRISGSVGDQDGAPVAGAWVYFEHVKTADMGACASDAEGKFSCGAMTGGGVYRPMVYVSADQRVELRPASGGRAFPGVALKDGQSHATGVRLVVQRDELVIAGRVVDTGGAGVMDARVDALPTKPGAEPRFNSWTPLPTAVTGRRGKFELRGLPSGNYALRARHGGGAESVAVNVAAGSRGVVIRVERPGRIEGQLVGYGELPPVYVERVPASGSFAPATVEGARFHIDGLAPGKYVVTAQTLAEGDAELVEVRAGKVAKVTLTSRGSGVLDGTVTEWESGAPVVGATCHTVLRAESHGGITNWSMETAPRTDAEGRFHLEPGPAGEVLVSCFGDSTSRAMAEATVPSGGRSTVSMRVVRHGKADSNGSIGASFGWRDTVPRVTGVEPGRPAAAAGLAVGDVVTAFNGASLEGVSSSGMMVLVAKQPLGSEVALTVRRGEDSRVVAVTVISATRVK